MPMQPRLDATETLHLVRGRGIEGTEIFEADPDREDFPSRLGKLCQEGSLGVYAWIERGTFVLPVGGGQDGISGSVGGEVLGSNAIGGNPCGPFGVAA
jgi:hypothetical protein